MTQELTDPKESRLAVLLRTPQIQTKFNEVLGKRTPAFVTSVIAACNANDDLKVCEPMSIIGAAMTAAVMNLPINPNLGFAHIVPYAGKAQFQMGYKGFVQLAMRTGQYRTMNAAVVHEGELVSHNHFSGEIVLDQSKKTSDKVIGYVSYFRLITGFEKYFYMTLEEVTAHGKRYSKSYSNKNSRWQLDFETMALKTVTKLLLSKWGILSIDLEKALDVDQGIIDIEGNVVYEDNPGEAKTDKTTKPAQANRLKNLVNEAPAAPQADGGASAEVPV